MKDEGSRRWRRLIIYVLCQVIRGWWNTGDCDRGPYEMWILNTWTVWENFKLESDYGDLSLVGKVILIWHGSWRSRLWGCVMDSTDSGKWQVAAMNHIQLVVSWLAEQQLTYKKIQHCGVTNLSQWWVWVPRFANSWNRNACSSLAINNKTVNVRIN